MGYERKRGKLAELNSFLRGGSRACFSLIVGNTEGLEKVRYIITLDTDTQLPRDAAWQLVGAMAHPLNRPQYDEKRPTHLCRIRDPSATSGGESARHEPVTVCPHVGKRCRH